MMAEEKYVCEDCKKSGLFSENHNDCEKLYIDTRLNAGVKRTSADCQCENIGHGWNVHMDYDKEVTDEDVQDLNDVAEEISTPNVEGAFRKISSP